MPTGSREFHRPRRLVRHCRRERAWAPAATGGQSRAASRICRKLPASWTDETRCGRWRRRRGRRLFQGGRRRAGRDAAGCGPGGSAQDARSAGRRAGRVGLRPRRAWRPSPVRERPGTVPVSRNQLRPSHPGLDVPRRRDHDVQPAGGHARCVARPWPIRVGRTRSTTWVCCSTAAPPRISSRASTSTRPAGGSRSIPRNSSDTARSRRPGATASRRGFSKARSTCRCGATSTMCRSPRSGGRPTPASSSARSFATFARRRSPAACSAATSAAA